MKKSWWCRLYCITNYADNRWVVICLGFITVCLQPEPDQLYADHSDGLYWQLHRILILNRIGNQKTPEAKWLQEALVSPIANFTCAIYDDNYSTGKKSNFASAKKKNSHGISETQAVEWTEFAGTYQYEPASNLGALSSPLKGLVITPFTTMP